MEKRFKDENVVVFEGDEFELNGETLQIYGITGVDLKNDRVQLRDDLLVLSKEYKIPLYFDKLVRHWDKIEPQLLILIKKKNIFNRNGKVGKLNP